MVNPTEKKIPKNPPRDPLREVDAVVVVVAVEAASSVLADVVRMPVQGMLLTIYYYTATCSSPVRSMDHHGSNQTPEMKLGHHVVTPPTQPRRFLDPALDPDPKPYRQRSRSKRGRGTPSQEEKKNQQPKKRENRPIKAPTIRRPVAIAQR